MKQLILVLFLLLVAARLAIAALLDLSAEEAYYWQCGQRPVLGYVGRPPLTAMLVRLGTELLGDTALGVRLPFLLIGSAIPFVIFHLARPLVGSRDAWLAAGITLALPFTTPLGVFAIPDGPLLLWTSLFVLGLERATRTGRFGGWLLAGLSGALGLLTHCRFLLVLAAAFLYLVATPNGRRQWGRPGVWSGLSILAPGLLLELYIILRSQFYPVRYQAGRHSTTLDVEAVAAYLGEQALVVSPLLLLALCTALVGLWQRARRGDDRAALFYIFAGSVLGFFLLASPFEDSGMMTAHWPLPGYLPLLVFLPEVLRRLLGSRPGLIRRSVVVLVPGIGTLIVLLSVLEWTTGWIQMGSLRRPFMGWSVAAEQVRRYQNEFSLGSDGKLLVVADNYKLGSSLEFRLYSRASVYILDHGRSRRHGRAPQFRLWNIDEVALRNRAGEDALVVMQEDEIREGKRADAAWMNHVGSFFERLEPLTELGVKISPDGRKFELFHFYRGVRIQSSARVAEPPVCVRRSPGLSRLSASMASPRV